MENGYPLEYRNARVNDGVVLHAGHRQHLVNFSATKLV